MQSQPLSRTGRTVATLKILSAGAAQAVTERIIEGFKRDTGSEVTADFGAVGAMRARVVGGEPVDVVILTRTMIDELVTGGWLAANSQLDLGKVGTGVAVRAGTRAPDISTTEALGAAILAAGKIVCPDPAIATAGKVVMNLLDQLNVAAEVRQRMQFFPNGYAAMSWLASNADAGELGITQITEIRPNKGVAFAGPLPDTLQQKTVYSAAVASQASERELARDFLARFAAPSARGLLEAGGYELGPAP